MTAVIVSSPETTYSGELGGLNFAQGRAHADTEQHAAEIAYCRNAGYTVSEPEPEPEPEPEQSDQASGEFDPAEHTVPEVQAYLADADETERARVLAAEQTGKQRAGITQQGAGQ